MGRNGGYWHRQTRPVSTLDPHVLRYVAERKTRGEISTTKGTVSTLLGFSDVFGDRPLHRLSVHDVDRWAASRQHLRPSSYRVCWLTVRRFCRWLLKRGHVSRDVFDELTPPRSPKSQPRALELEEVHLVVGACPDARARAIVWLELGSALRRIEVSRAEVGDWDRRAGGIIARGKGSKERWVPLLGPTITYLDVYLDEHPATSGPLIRSYKHPWRPITADYVGAIVSTAFAVSGVRKAPYDGKSGHALRHTAATETIDGEGDPRVAQELLGHEHLSTTVDIYIGRVALPRLVQSQCRRLARYTAVDAPADPAA